MAGAAFGDGERLEGERTALRLVTEADCTEAYRGWLADPEVARYLETRWAEQTLDAIRRHVAEMRGHPDTYLFAILDRADGAHVGNIKIGPVNRHHRCADVSYFIGDRSRWGKGLASDAIRTVTDFGFRRLELHRVQAGVYASNVASCKALEKAGLRYDGALRRQLLGAGGWEDHVWYGVLEDEWQR